MPTIQISTHINVSPEILWEELRHIDRHVNWMNDFEETLEVLHVLNGSAQHGNVLLGHAWELSGVGSINDGVTVSEVVVDRTVSGTHNTCTIAGAAVSTTYTISVSAVSAAGTGVAATQSFTTPAAATPVLPSAVIVSFTGSSSVLSATAKKTLAAFAKEIDGGTIHVIINGFGKTVAIARARALAVANYLIATGAEVRVSVQANTGTSLNKVSVSPATA